MSEEAPLVDIGAGLVPARDGWFVLNARDAAWLVRDRFGSRCPFSADTRLVEGTDVEPWYFPQIGINLTVLQPGDCSSLYHAEAGQQEDFLVLAGRCTAVIEEQERELEAWDLAHCPPGTRHVFVNTSDEPCILLMVGARRDGRSGIVYPASEVAQRHGAAVEVTTDSPHEAYAPYPHWRAAGARNPVGL